MGNNAANVSVGKPNVNGAIYTAPFGTALPAAADSKLSDDYTCLGYVSEDGLRNNNSKTSTEIKAWGGDVVNTTQTDKKDTFKVKLIEALNKAVLEAVYNTGNVSGDLETGIVVRANSAEAEAHVWIYDTIMNGNVLKRIVVPNGKISEIAEIVYKDTEAVGYDVTINALPGGSAFGNDTHKEYIKKSADSGT